MKEDKLTNLETVNEYIQSFPEPIQTLMRQYQSIFQEALPEATQRISWQMPTFYQNGNVIHFMPAKKHMGIYPGAEALAAFRNELELYSTSKGTLRIPYETPIPIDLLQRIAKFSAQENLTLLKQKEEKKKAALEAKKKAKLEAK